MSAPCAWPIKDHCRGIQTRIRDQVGELPGITWRTIPDPEGDFGFELYFFLDDPKLVKPFQTALDQRLVNCLPRTGTYPQYYRENVLTGRSHHPAASPFRDLKPWPGPGYLPENFPVTENLTQRFIALPIGWKYTPADADHIAQALREIHAEVC